VNQSTIPVELPIVGDPDVDVILSTVFPKGPTLFQLDGKRLQLLQPLDRDADNLSHMVFQGTPYETSVSELAPIGTTIFDKVSAQDIDAGVNGLAEYFIIPADNNTLEAANAVDGYGSFSIPLPHQGQVIVNRSLDYERTQKYLVTIVASVRNPFYYDNLCSQQLVVNSGVLAGILTIEPEKIQAVDMDTLDARIRYTIDSGEPDSWASYFAIDPSNGAVRQLVPAEEVSEAKRFTTAKLTITVRPVDANPPVVDATSDEGQVEENSPKGTNVLDAKGMPIRLTVSDSDLGPGDPIPKYTFELTTNFFDIDGAGYLVVSDENLDRDPPNPGKFRFQVVAREANGGAASAPFSLAVQLLDQNDNAPVIPKTQPIIVPASLEPAPVHKVDAVDIDQGENARITYSIYHVSNNGGNKFTIDPSTGVIFRATDAKGLSSQGIVEISVAPGPNTRPPQFSSRDYYALVSEGAAINSTVTTVTAKDPENEPVTYSIMSGNDLRQFTIGANTGIITVIRSVANEFVGYVHATDLDEGTNAKDYEFVVTATDGAIDKRLGTASVTVQVQDIPDESPVFQQALYSVHVPENVPNYPVVKVQAEDPDTIKEITYTILMGDTNTFSIDRKTGLIRTLQALDRESVARHELTVGTEEADEGAPGASTTVEILVDDKNDNSPIFTSAIRPVTIEDSSSIGSLVQAVIATDSDSTALNNRVRYKLVGRGKASIYFNVEPDTGAVRVRDDLRKETDSEYTVRVFYVKLTEDRDCAIYLNTSSLDYETISEYTLEVQLESIQGLINPESSRALVRVHVTDANDNAPAFTLSEQSSILAARGKHFAIVTKDMLLGTNVLQAAEEYFTLDADTGIISNIKTFETVPREVLPFKFSVTARDNPGSNQDYNIARAVEERSGLVAGLQKLTARHYRTENGTLQSDGRGTEAWLYLLHPTTGEILPRDSDLVKKAIESGVHKAVAARLQSPVSEIRAPLEPAEPPRKPHIAAAPLTTALPAALIALAAVVLVVAVAAVIYICASWSSISMPPPRPASGYESSEDDPAPRYETQVTIRDSQYKHAAAAPGLRVRVQ
ncbi:Protocadherin-15, partial [Operophtera brumata]